jgi:hypothetical protein
MLLPELWVALLQIVQVIRDTAEDVEQMVLRKVVLKVHLILAEVVDLQPVQAILDLTEPPGQEELHLQAVETVETDKTVEPDLPEPEETVLQAQLPEEVVVELTGPTVVCIREVPVPMVR